MTTMPMRATPLRQPHSARTPTRCRRGRRPTRCPGTSPPRPVVLARYYDPTIGRFTAVDPIVDTEQPGSLDRFGYGYDSPVTLSDPTGLWVDVGLDRRMGSYDARRPLATTGPKGTGTPTKLRLPGKTYTPVRAPASGRITVRPESVAIFNAPAGPTELAGCSCETSGGDDFASLFTNKDKFNELADHPAYVILAPPVANGLQALATANECLDGGKLVNCGYAVGELVASLSGGKWLASTGRVGAYAADIIVDFSIQAAELAKEAAYDWVQRHIFDGEQMAPDTFTGPPPGAIL